MAKKDAEKKMSKANMVRDAIEKLGWAADIDAYHAYIVQTFGIDMSKPHISQTKSNERKRQGVRGRRRRKGGRGAASEETGAVVGSAKVSDILSFVDTIREWESKLGAAGIREIVKTVLRK